eukprot:2748942-Alexandrium_andersonii.AAC.1
MTPGANVRAGPKHPAQARGRSMDIRRKRAGGAWTSVASARAEHKHLAQALGQSIDIRRKCADGV